MKDNNSRAARRETRRSLRPGERAASEVISVLLLLGVVVVGVGIIAVTIYSQPTPEKTPQVSILISKTADAILLTHNGGDSLAEGSFYVLADGARLDGPAAPSGGVWPWSIGETLQYNVASAPERVQVVYSGGGGAALLKSATFSGAAGTAGPDVPVGTGGGEWIESELNISFDTIEERDAWVVEQFVEQLENNSIYLSQNVQNQHEVWKSSGSFEFTISGRNSSLNLSTNNANDNDPDTVTFTVGESVRIELHDSQIRFFAIGQSGWHVFATDISIYRDGTELPYKFILGGKIEEFNDFTSSITIKTTASKNLHTDLYINNVPIISGIWNTEITLTNIKPAEPTLMILDISKNDPNYFVGTAESITGYD